MLLFCRSGREKDYMFCGRLRAAGWDDGRGSCMITWELIDAAELLGGGGGGGGGGESSEFAKMLTEIELEN